MFLLTIIRSDSGCFEEREIAVDEIGAVDAYACDCGHHPVRRRTVSAQ
jgi:hypothetical protein